MSSKLIAAISCFCATWLVASDTWKVALPGYHYEFPRDHFSHDDYQTEWWYYTGNFKGADGHRFGFELTFFRKAIELPEPATRSSQKSVWRPDQTYLAHLALSDIDGGKFYHFERLNRAGPGLAGASFDQRKIWNGNWHVRWTSDNSDAQEVQAVCERFTLQLTLTPEKPVVIHGKRGVSPKGPDPGQASHYISFSRLQARGTLTLNDRQEQVSGLAWMDHEFFTEKMDATLSGWDWFAVQLNNREELMLYRLRNKPGPPERFSSGTYIDSHGVARTLEANQFTLTPVEWWTSPASKAGYPVGWEISIPSLGLQLSQRTELKGQELLTQRGVSPGYWEGAVTYRGKARGVDVQGVGYLELTGYAGPLLF